MPLDEFENEIMKIREDSIQDYEKKHEKDIGRLVGTENTTLLEFTVNGEVEVTERKVSFPDENADDNDPVEIYIMNDYTVPIKIDKTVFNRCEKSIDIDTIKILDNGVGVESAPKEGERYIAMFCYCMPDETDGVSTYNDLVFKINDDGTVHSVRFTSRIGEDYNDIMLEDFEKNILSYLEND